METMHLIITGKVQGVFYRASAKKKAEELDLRGWVKNTAEGSVEAMITGNNQQVEDFLQWCKSGPAKAIVKNVRIHKKQLKEFESFRIER